MDALLLLSSKFSSLLRHFNTELPIRVIPTCHSIIFLNPLSTVTGRQCPVAYWSRKLTFTEAPYQLHNEEMLATVTAFREWHHYHLEGSTHPNSLV
jgi:hypothetical protein